MAVTCVHCEAEGVGMCNVFDAFFIIIPTSTDLESKHQCQNPVQEGLVWRVLTLEKFLYSGIWGKRPHTRALNDCFKDWASCECPVKNESDMFSQTKYNFTAKDVRINSASIDLKCRNVCVFALPGLNNELYCM